MIRPGNNLYRVTFQVSRTYRCATIEDARFLAALTQQTMLSPGKTDVHGQALDLAVKITNIVPIGEIEP